jgi:ribosomal protein S12 methylthiotransferase accessory factor
MVTDPDLVLSMHDHSELYGADEAFDRFDFLLSGGQGRTTRPFDSTAFTHDDLTEDLVELVRRYLDCGQDVIVIDQTGPELQASHLSCVKVLVPGMLPMTFGHRNRRIDGLPRLREVPVLLGHRSTPLPDDEINPHPHPFP